MTAAAPLPDDARSAAPQSFRGADGIEYWSAAALIREWDLKLHVLRSVPKEHQHMVSSCGRKVKALDYDGLLALHAYVRKWAGFTEPSDDDREWFEQHPERQFRVRRAAQGEIEMNRPPERLDLIPLCVVQNLAPGLGIPCHSIPFVRQSQK